jgi:nicotinate-nucleotide pyrophosphorylase (carboxylating)
MDLEQEIDRLIDIAIHEDIPTGETASKACISEEAISTCRLIQKQGGVIAGLPYLKKIFQKVNPNIEVTFFVNEGSYQKSGTIIGKIEGPTYSILNAERTALNLIQHASGVATLTEEFVRRISGYDCCILDTRRTLPGLRALEKYAVTVGGGVIHRYGLEDKLIIKINHIRFVAKNSNTKNPVTDAYNLVREKHPDRPIEIEVDHVNNLQQALETDAYAVILRNLLPNQIQKCVWMTRKTNKKIYLDAGGTTTINTIRTYAETGVDGISVGDLIHGAESIDIRLRLI